MTVGLGAASFRSVGPVVCAVVGLVAVPRTSTAQDPQPSQTIIELQQRLDEIERTMKTQVATLRQQIADLEAKQPIAQTQGATGAAAPPPAGSGSAQEATFARDRESVARVNNQPLDPALQGFVPIPGTPARLKVDGYAKLDTIVDASPAGNTDQFFPSSIPVGLTDAQRVASTTLHVRQTRLNLDFRSPADFGGDFRTYAEIDFFGTSGSLDPRMRHFYGQVMNLLIGQTWTTFTDVDAFPDTLDFSGPAGISLLRQAQVRYTQPLRGRQSLAFAIERPLTQAPQTPDGGAAYSPAPDVIVRYRLERDRSHLQVGTLVRALGYRVAARNKTTAGVGFNASGAWKATDQDLVIGYVAYGAGIARYIDNLAAMGADLDRNETNTGVTALSALGTYTALTHQWPRRFRTTGVLGYSSIDNTAAQAATAFRNSYYVATNLLWNPAGSLNVGVEYLFGTHRLKDGADAHASRVQFAAKYDLFRKRALEP
jgi:hypothetical protein